MQRDLMLRQGCPCQRKTSGNGLLSKPGKSQGILGIIRETWKDLEKSGKINGDGSLQKIILTVHVLCSSVKDIVSGKISMHKVFISILNGEYYQGKNLPVLFFKSSPHHTGVNCNCQMISTELLKNIINFWIFGLMKGY